MTSSGGGLISLAAECRRTKDFGVSPAGLVVLPGGCGNTSVGVSGGFFGRGGSCGNGSISNLVGSVEGVGIVGITGSTTGFGSIGGKFGGAIGGGSLLCIAAGIGSGCKP